MRHAPVPADTPLVPERSAMLQALEAAMGSCSAVLPARKQAVPPKEPAAVLSPVLADALAMAIRFHARQVRKGTSVPYLTHLLAVAALVGESGGGEEEMIAALLHDAVEDGGGRSVAEEIRQRFGAQVAAIVAVCTDDESGGEKAPWLERKAAFLRQLAAAPLPALRVVCADKLHNAQCLARDLRDLGPSVFERFRADREGTLWYYRSVARILGTLLQDEPSLDPGFRSLIRELRETVVRLDG